MRRRVVSKTTKLHEVQPKTATAKIREQVKALLNETLAECDAGQIDEIVLIIKRPGTDVWGERSTETQFKSSWIGKLEILKLDWWWAGNKDRK